MRRILCFGDSNTYGFDPREPINKRYPAEVRWPEILQLSTGHEVINMGENGRTIPYTKNEVSRALSQIQRHIPADLLIIMLGSNDAFSIYEPTAKKIAHRMNRFVEELLRAIPELHILLVSPVIAEIPEINVQEIYQDLIPLYLSIANHHHIQYASASAWKLPLSADGVHFTPEANQIFAQRIKEYIE